MSNFVRKLEEVTILQEIANHPAWFGKISGLKAERILRGLNKPYLFMLRQGEYTGEHEADYYVTFILPDFSVKHQPFIINVLPNGWEWSNGGGGTCSADTSIDGVLHCMMHCEQHECSPFVSRIKGC